MSSPWAVQHQCQYVEAEGTGEDVAADSGTGEAGKAREPAGEPANI